MPCLFSSNTNLNHGHYQQEHQVNSSYNSNDYLISSLNNLDLSNPFNIAATISPSSSVWSLNNLNYINEEQQQEIKMNYFEPLPFFQTQNQLKQMNYPQLSQKHTIIKQSMRYRILILIRTFLNLVIDRKAKQQKSSHHRLSYNSCDNLFSSTSHRKKRQICSFCKSNGESASVYTSHGK